MKVDFLEHRITQEGLKMDDHKVKAILDWEPPKLVPRLEILLRIGFLLSQVHQELCEYNRTFDKPLEEVRRHS
jgi:hypothetical protein